MSDFIKKYWEKITTKITTNKVLSAFIVLVIAAVIVGSISISSYSDSTFLEGILIETHGMLFDILIIGVFILWLNRLGERRIEVQRYKDEIDDFRHWESDEAKYRIVGNIKRLNRLNISAINLISCYLYEAILPRLNLQGAKLQFANLEGAELKGANLEGANFWRTKLQNAYLWNAKLQSANLREAVLQGADLTGANLQHAILQEAKLQGANFCDTDLTFALFNLEQIAKVKTLYKAKMDDELTKQIEENYPHLLAKPDWLKGKDE